MITRQMLEDRLASLERDRLALMGQVNAHDGAIADCKHWLTQMNVADTRINDIKRKG